MKCCCAGIALVSAVFVTGCGWFGPTFKLTCRVAFPASHPQFRLASDWADEIKRRTHGHVRITVSSDETLGKADACYAGVVSDAFDIGSGPLPVASGRFPLLSGLTLPLGCPNGESATRMANALFAKYRPVECGDVKMLYLHASGPTVLAARMPVLGMAGMKGLKVWTPECGEKVVEALGAFPIVGEDAYGAMRERTANAVFCPLEAFKTKKLADVVNCVTDTKVIGGSAVFFVAMNKEKWAALPPDIQKSIETVSGEWVARHGQAWGKADGEGFAALKAQKRDVLALPTFEMPLWTEKVAPLLQDYAANADKKGLPGSAFLEDLKKSVIQARADLKASR